MDISTDLLNDNYDQSTININGVSLSSSQEYDQCDLDHNGEIQKHHQDDIHRTVAGIELLLKAAHKHYLAEKDVIQPDGCDICFAVKTILGE